LDGELFERHYKVKELAEMFSTDESFWRKRIANGEIKAIKIGRCVRIPESEVLKVMKEIPNDKITAIEKINAILP